MRGAVEAIVGHFDRVVNNTILDPGSIPEGQPVFISPLAHASAKGPVSRWASGMGRLYSDGDRIILRGRFDLATAIGRTGYGIAERMAGRGRWSINFTVLDTYLGIRCKPDAVAPVRITRALVYEATPILRPADPDTRTLSLGDRVFSSIGCGS
jgi:hypothetical protein